MAALMRMSKIVNSTSIRCAIRSGLSRKYTLTAERIVPQLLNGHVTRSPPFCRPRQYSVSVTEGLLKENTENEGQDKVQGHTGSGQGRDGKQRTDLTLENRIQNLENQMRRTSRIDRGQLFSILAMAKKEGSLSEQDALTFIRGCGAVLVKESAETRQKTLSDVLAQLQPLVKTFDISHHNAILRIKLENEEKIDPAQVLSDIEEKLNLFPNRITYQLLIAAYCNEGDLEGATKILTHMKSQDIPVNEAVFHALIRGHMKRGDVEGAKEILSSMKPAGLLPIAESYSALMCGFAEKGDVASVMQTLTEADSEEVSFQSRNLFDVLVTGVGAGHTSILDPLLREVKERFSHRPPYNHEAMNCAHRLVVLGKDAEAMEVFKAISDLPGPGYRQLLAKMFLEGCAIQNRSAEVLVKTMDELASLGYVTESQLQTIATVLVRFRHIDTAFDIYKEMVNRGEDVPRTILKPLFQYKLAQNDLDGLYKLAGEAKELLKWDKNVMYDIMLDIVQPLQRKDLSQEEIFSKLQENGLQESDITELKLLENIQQGQFTEAMDLVSKGCLPGLSAMHVFLVRGYQASNDLDGLFKFLGMLQNVVISQVYFKQITTLTLTRIIDRQDVTADQAEDLVRAFLKQNLIFIQGSGQQNLIEILRKKSVDPEKLSELEETFKNMSIPASSGAKPLSEEGLKNLAAILENSPGSVPVQLRNKAELRLLMQYCREGDVEKADKLKESMDERGFQFHGDIQRVLAVYYAKHKKDLMTALKYKEGLKTEEKSLSARCNLALAVLYAEQGDSQKVLAEITESDHKEANFKYQLMADCSNLLEICGRDGNLAFLREVTSALFDQGFVADGTNQVLAMVTRAHLEKGDADEIVAFVEHMATRYNKVVIQRDILSYFIEREDADRLQKVVDLLCSVYGEMDILHQLTFAFVECGKLRQARKILETPGLRAKMSIFDQELAKYFTRNKVTLMEQIVDITKDLFGINREEMLFWLMRMYARQKDAKKALGVLSNYEEEGISPRPRTLRYLAKVLESAEIPIPFTVPKALEKQEKPAVTDVELSETDRAFLTHLTADEIDQAWELKNNLSEGVLGDGLVTLCKNKQIQSAKGILKKIGEDGDVDSLLHVRHKLPQKVDAVTHQALFRAYLNSGRIEEFLTFISGNIHMFSKYLDVENFELVQEKKPEFFPKMVELVDQYIRENPDKYGPAHVLFCYYFINGQSEKASELLSLYPDMKPFVRTKTLSAIAATRKLDDLFPSILELAPQERTFQVYNKWLGLKCDMTDADGVLFVTESARSHGMELHHFNYGVLQNLQANLEKTGRSLPWTAEEIEQVLRAKEQKIASGRQGRGETVDNDENS